jgi:hypothetical protein
MKRLCRVTEAEVIAEFLKGEFYHAEFDRDRMFFEALVFDPHLADPAENNLRRALLFRRRATMWRELPADTQWWEIELEPEDLERVNVFPRAQWRSIAHGNFRALHVAELVHRQFDPSKPGDLAAKIHSLRTLMRGDGPRSTILLIGVDERCPATLLEGNHRFVASLLLPREVMLRRLRVMCGFSPAMERCCWYKTTVPNLVRYLKNRIKHSWGREADAKSMLPQTIRNQVVEDYDAHPAGMHTTKSE